MEEKEDDLIKSNFWSLYIASDPIFRNKMVIEILGCKEQPTLIQSYFDDLIDFMQVKE